MTDDDAQDMHRLAVGASSGGVVQPTDAQIDAVIDAEGGWSPFYSGDLHSFARAVLALAVPQAPLQAEPVPVVASEPVVEGLSDTEIDAIESSFDYVFHFAGDKVDGHIAQALCDTLQSIVNRHRAPLATPQAEPAVAKQAREAFDAWCRKEGGSRFTLWDVWQAAMASQSTPPPERAQTLGEWLHAAYADKTAPAPPPESAGQGLSDANRLDWLAPERGSRFLERERGMFRVYEDVAMPEAPHHKWQACTLNWWPTAQQAIDGAILAANPTAQPDGGSKA